MNSQSTNLQTNPQSNETNNANIVPDPDLETSGQTETLQEFHPFARLPPELRQIIWDLSVESQEPRIVDAEISSTTGLVISKVEQPACLFTNQESRGRALKKYNKIFFGDHKTPDGHIERRERIYFNPEKDSLYIPFPHSPLNPLREDFPHPSGKRAQIFSCKVSHTRGGFEKFYARRIDAVIAQGTPAILLVKFADIDNLYRGSRLSREHRILMSESRPLDTYHLTIALPKLTSLVFRYSLARFPKNVPWEIEQHLKDNESTRFDRIHDCFERLKTRQAMQSQHRASNRTGYVWVRFREVPAFKGYFLSHFDYSFDRTIFVTD